MGPGAGGTGPAGGAGRPAYFLPGSGRGGGVVLAAAALVLAAVLDALGFFASRLDFCWPFAMGTLLVGWE